MSFAYMIDQVDGADTADLLSQLSDGGDGRFAYTVEVSVDAGVHGGHGDGERYDPKQGRGPCLHQKSHGNPL